MFYLQMQRDSTKNSVQEARDNFNAANEAFLAKQQEVQPLQQGRKTQSDAQRAFQQEYRDLEVRSEAELDAKVINLKSHHMSCHFCWAPMAIHYGTVSVSLHPGDATSLVYCSPCR